MKNVAVLTEDGAFVLFFRPHPGGLDSSRVPREFAIQGKKNANARGSARGGAGRILNWLMHNWLLEKLFVLFIQDWKLNAIDDNNLFWKVQN